MSKQNEAGAGNGDSATFARLGEIDERLTAVRAELVSFADAGDLDDTAAIERFDALEAELGELETEREPIARRAATINRVREQVRSNAGVEHIGTGPQVMNRVQPFADLDEVQSGRSLTLGDVQSRALAAVEQAPSHLVADSARERAEELIRHHDMRGRAARHVLFTGSDDYARAFEMILSGRQPWQLPADLQRAIMFADEQNRALNEGTQSAGGYLVPFYLDPTIILANAGSTNPIRQIADVQTISTNNWHGITSAGVTAGYLAEGAEVGDNSPTFNQPSILLAKAAAYLQASFEVDQDTNVGSAVGRLLADAKDQWEAHEMLLGDGVVSGVTQHYQGVITGVAANAGSVVQTGTAGTFVVDDVYNVSDSVPDRYAPNASWLAHRKITSKIRQFATGTGQQTGSFWATLGMGTPSLLLDAPIRKASALDSTVATGKNILLAGDFKHYKVLDRIGMTVQYEPLVKGANQRPTGQVGWFAHWRGGGAVVIPDAFRLLQVK